MKNILMFESEKDLLDNYDKIIYKSHSYNHKALDYIVTIDIEPIIIKNVVCNKLKFYKESTPIYDNCGHYKGETSYIVLYAWGTLPFADEDVWKFTSNHPLYKNFEYLIKGSILFLDIDGVLNSETHASSYTEDEWENLTYFEKHIDNKAIQIINHICDKTKAQVVISSTWRCGRGIEQLQNILNFRGATFKVIDKTPEYDISYRGYEIDAWISKNRSKDKDGNYFEFTNYAILDDDIGDMLIKQKDNIFKINRLTGITRKDADRIVEFLNKVE